ncbi:Nif11-like leader peptide family natural product precursor [Nodularia sp. UHCC 0506]|uniref:Nif11-like leader peptide family natural product precursor n=1 Tax=Nodularia sp. UHCC 0506 TaxID=3110243 RepID=UPI002B1FFD03|nr:Nif11-like leader peptide family natural product precursor [Nodularia sp. UHCC 0506]MEA5515620.1 Nif11-like leader peptide family natural product precursor [Nodularia sp. UHCC 0506]
MTSFNRSTSRRLKTLTQIPSVWEGDRRPMSTSPTQDADSQGECILWVDGSQGVVRGMDVVSPETGPEAIVRTLMRAMEHPHSPGKPARPQKIVVKDREIQFYLRGVLQDLDIAIDYVPELPLIDELFRGFTEILENQVPNLPPQYAQALHNKALTLWQSAPWEFLEEQQILSIEINSWDVGTLYASIMGMLGMEYGILLYRSEDSLKQFRAAVLQDDELQERLEEAFLKQDCLFLTFESEDEDEIDEDEDLADLPISKIEPTFGNIHPLEGLRSVLYEEESLAVFVALESLSRFIRDYQSQLDNDTFPSLSRSYPISLPKSESESIKSLSVTVSTMPQLAAELEEMAGFDLEEEEEDLLDFSSLRDDLIPEDSFLSLGVISWEMLESLRQGVQTHQGSEIAKVGDGFPVILIQTSRPKAKTVIESIGAAGGLKAICFNPGADPFDGDRYDLGLLQTEDNELFLFGEFLDDDPTHIEARKKWNQRCKNTKGYCGLIIAKGLTGASRGNPQLRDMMALFETRSLSPQDLGLGTLQLMPQV